MFVFTSCGDDPFSKVKSENVKSAEARDNTPFKYPVMTFDRKIHDFGTKKSGFSAGFLTHWYTMNVIFCSFFT